MNVTKALADFCGISESLIKMYVHTGLYRPSDRPGSGRNRNYTLTDVVQLLAIRHASKAGVSNSGINELTALLQAEAERIIERRAWFVVLRNLEPSVVLLPTAEGVVEEIQRCNGDPTTIFELEPIVEAAETFWQSEIEEPVLAGG